MLYRNLFGFLLHNSNILLNYFVREYVRLWPIFGTNKMPCRDLLTFLLRNNNNNPEPSLLMDFLYRLNVESLKRPFRNLFQFPNLFGNKFLSYSVRMVYYLSSNFQTLDGRFSKFQYPT